MPHKSIFVRWQFWFFVVMCVLATYEANHYIDGTSAWAQGEHLVPVTSLANN